MSSVAVASLTKAQKTSLSVSYACLLLSDSKKEITVENITNILKAAKLDVDAGFLKTFATALKGQDVSKFLSFGGGSSTTQAAPVASSKPAEKAKAPEVKAPEPAKEEEDMDMGGLFD